MTICCLYLFLGCFLEGISVLALTLPVVLPIVSSVGWDPIWFGIVLVVLIEIALVTPPIGLNLYILTAVAPDVPIETVIRSVLWFIPADLALLVLLYFVPQLALWLPSLMFQ
jgi:C4-dicarboxylate transporter DctM subunit